MKSAKRLDGSTVDVPSRLDALEVRFEVERHGTPVDVVREVVDGRLCTYCWQ
jgi:hypothetical protein